jgi:flagellar biosynthesis anti-sigma factor FlgM
MSMKIDGNRPAGSTSDAEATRRLDQARKAAERTAVERQTDKGDRVEVSKDAQLMTSALKAAQEAPAIRQDVVERARQALDKGEVGKDSQKLADRLIDALLNR